jgi:hypothetical protein
MAEPGMIRTLFWRFTERTVLLLIHFIILVGAYIALFWQELVNLIKGRRRMAVADLLKLTDIPSHVAIVLDEDATKFRYQIAETLDFVTQIPQVSLITVFFRHSVPKISFPSQKVRVFQSSDVAPAFTTVMMTGADLASTSYPLDVKLDLVIVYSRTSSLCNFFPWNLDLATIVLAGPVVRISPLSIVNAFAQYGETEQRFGK